MIYRTVDGNTFEGRSYEAIVNQMAEEKLRIPRSLSSYRFSVALRVEGAYDKHIDPRTNRAFLEGLVAAGLLERIR